MLAAAPTPPAQEAEPVGYLNINDNGTRFFSWGKERDAAIKLYTRPASDELRKAADDMRLAIEKLPMLAYCDLKDEYESLCTALGKK